MCRCIVFLAFLSCLDAESQEWREYRSNNYLVYSDMEPAKITETIGEFEIHRHIVMAFLNTLDDGTTDPLRVIVFDRDGEYRRLTGATGRGYYWSTYDGAHAVLSRRGLYRFKNVNVYYLIKDVAQLDYPRWYEDGLASVLTDTRIEQDSVMLGLQSEWRLAALYRGEVATLDNLLDRYDEIRPDVDDDEYEMASWLMVHLLQIRSFEQNPEFRQQTTEYLRRFAAGQDSRLAFEESFEWSLDRIEREYRRYGRSTVAPSIEIPMPEVDTEVRSRSITDAERTHLLGDLALDLRGTEGALDYLNEIPVDQYDERTASLRALVEARRGDFEAADRFSAIVEDRDDAVTLRHLGYTEYVRYMATSGAIADDALSKAVVLAEAALSVDPDDVDSHLLLWRAYRARGDAVAAAKSMMAGYHRNETNIELNGRIAMYLVEEGRPDLARPFLERVLNWSRSKDQRRWARDELEALESQVERPD